MVMLWMWSVLWRENGHFTEVLTLMDICIFYCILWSIDGALFLVYSISLPLNLLIFLFLFINVFLHTPKFMRTGEQEDFMPAKKSKYVKAEKGNDILINVWESMSV